MASSSESIAAALAARGGLAPTSTTTTTPTYLTSASSAPDVFDTNLAGLQACAELGPAVTARHAAAGDFDYFLAPKRKNTEPTIASADAAAGAAQAPVTSLGLSPELPVTPVAGNVLCGVALRALAAVPPTFFNKGSSSQSLSRR